MPLHFFVYLVRFLTFVCVSALLLGLLEAVEIPLWKAGGQLGALKGAKLGHVKHFLGYVIQLLGHVEC